ncbi:MAG TPA: hypothetical protein VK024_02600 [Actinomycetaceae bacterium]|nr:hypothetical protein [Actinomycetaceae bacterium]
MADEPGHDRVTAQLVAVIAAVRDGVPMVLTTAGGRQFPAGPLQPDHRSMQEGLRAWVRQQTGYHLGYVEQLYTFADRDRGGGPVLEVTYLGLTRAAESLAGWRSWFAYFPWEDRRAGSGTDIVDGVITPRLLAWAQAGPDPAEVEARRTRCAVTFGLEGRPWLPEMALQRYELLYEAGLVPESPHAIGDVVPGDAMARHHRRILATGIGRLRAKIQYQPVVFEMLPATFTLGELQDTVEAIAGQNVHTQNFRRLVTQQGLVEDAGDVRAATGGRPARLVRFRRSVVDERDAAGTKLPVPRTR